jgi:ATP-dependent Lon protease
MSEPESDGTVVLDEPAEARAAAGRVEARKLPSHLPILPLKDTVVFPRLPMPLVVGRPASLRLIDDAMLKDRLVGLAAQRDPRVDAPGPGDLYAVGTAAAIQRLLKFPDGTVRVLLSGLDRIRLGRVVRTDPYLVAEIEVLADRTDDSVEIEALTKNLLQQIQKMLSLMPIASDEIGVALLNAEEPARLADLAAALLVRDTAQKQELLETLSVKERLRRLTRHVSREIEVLELGSKIQQEIQDEMEKGQREFVLRQQLKAIQKELGAGDETEEAIRRLQEAIEKAGLPPPVKEVADRELGRLRTTPPAAAEHVVVRTYLDWILALPWTRETEDKIDLPEARRVLDEDHYDLEKVKERILEFLAVRKLRAGGKGPILCFIGPPGTGKTSLGRSIARAMGRAFHRISLGGVRDEAEIRGHRRTYVGALPGRIIEGLRKCGTRNPVFMLDEIDKIGADFRGDPAAALLEVLDPEQNAGFVDHYLDLAFDLSRVMFITTGNVLHSIPAALLDRMEVLELPGYTEEEKQAIARRYLIPRQAAENGLAADEIRIDDAALTLVISRYTQEAGLRNLEREIATLCRKAARRKAEGEAGPFTVDVAALAPLLGPERFASEVAERAEKPGVSIGLAWTPFGGQILFVEATRMPGGKSLILTGQLGDVMRESAQAALSYVRSRAAALGVDPGFFARSDIHLHVPAGAIPKDGPSAGATMAAALASLLTGRPCRPETAMTGEITLRGKVLPVGGIKEKLLAARRAGIRTVIVPAENRKDLQDVPKETLDRLDVRFARSMDEVLEAALLAAGPEAPGGAARRGGARRARPGAGGIARRPARRAPGRALNP